VQDKFPCYCDSDHKLPFALFISSKYTIGSTMKIQQQIRICFLFQNFWGHFKSIILGYDFLSAGRNITYPSQANQEEV
jgi:hypothetical protein